ncbi:MAG TPA: hypothetical protein VFA95_11740 [Gammaproteobacteria bacterium]|nr:hypothetical protein [Gammaproteobacteria bacterium]
MNRLPNLRPEFKALNTATLLFAGLGILMALSYMVVSHMGTTGLLITPHDIADGYYGPGMSTNTLIGMAHIHMMGLLPVFWLIGFIFVHSTISLRWRIFWCVLPFIAFPVDVAGWFLTHHYYGFVYETIVAGGAFVLSVTVMMVVSLYQMWITPWRYRARTATPAAEGFTFTPRRAASMSAARAPRVPEDVPAALGTRREVNGSNPHPEA